MTLKLLDFDRVRHLLTTGYELVPCDIKKTVMNVGQ